MYTCTKTKIKNKMCKNVPSANKLPCVVFSHAQLTGAMLISFKGLVESFCFQKNNVL